MLFFKRLWRHAFFSDVNPIIQLGATRSLEAADLPALPEYIDPRAASTARAAIDWSSGPRLLKSALRAVLGLSVRAQVFYLLNVGFTLLGPVLINRFVKRLQEGLPDDAALIEAAVYAVGIGVSGIVAGLSIQHYFLRSLHRNQILINLINSRIFAHALVLSKSARERIPAGDIVNHLSTDTESVAEVGTAISDLIYCVTIMGGALGLLFHYLGSTAWVAIAVMTLLAPITRKVSRDFTRFDEDLMKHRDQRVSMMTQILNAIRLVKYFAWEKSVEADIAAIRGHELHARRRIARAELLGTLVYVSVGTFVLFAVLGVHSWRGGSFDAALIFTTVSLFSILEDPFSWISRVISIFINARVGADRIAKFLNEPVTLTATGAGFGKGPVGLEMNGLSIHLGENRHHSLREVSLRLEPGQSLAVVGPVGAGKSTFIHALLGEIEPSGGEFHFFSRSGESLKRCRIGYVPQEAYVLNSTMRENLTFGNSGIAERDIWHALELAGLAWDVRAMKGGLDAEIGEKGINLSGGQRQRLSLARAVLHKPQLAVLDDPLSAVDPHTEAHLVKHLLFGEWRSLTRVVITHRLGHLREFDRIAFLEDGRLTGFGTFAELEAGSAAFRAYLAEHEASHAHAPVTENAAAAPASTAAEVAVAAPAGEASRITEDEDREWGAVGGGVYFDYIRALGGESKRTRPFILLALGLAACSGTVFPMIQKVWLAMVSNAQGGQSLTGWQSAFQSWAQTPQTAVYVYGFLGLLVLAASLSSDLFWLQRGLAAGRNIHDRMLRSVLGTGIRFFDATPAGRIVQRFARDMEAIDIQLQWSFDHSMRCLAQVLVILTLIVTALPVVLIFIVPVLAVYYRVQKLYRSSAREAKRLDSIARSPRYAHFKETLNGLVVIRAFGKTDWFLEEFFARLSHSQRMFYGHYMVNRWFSTRIPVVGGMVSIFTGLAVVWSVRAGSLTPGMAGLLAVYSLSFWGVLNWGIRIWAEVEARMTSMERVKTYSRLVPEPLRLKEAEVPAEWPARGEVRFENVFARYASHLPQVLKDLSFNVEAGQKVGIVGRTGSGKSSLFQSLYRFLEIESGRILIDGVDIAAIELPRLRRALAIIPQDPTLFMGSVRKNLDREGEFSDAELWAVLERTSLDEVIRRLPGGLDSELTENGANLSQGQRQLMCLARALLMRARVIILDEATASVDVKTDAQVQRVVREACTGVTMLIIAHRLGTVADCDQILEIREGRARTLTAAAALTHSQV